MQQGFLLLSVIGKEIAKLYHGFVQHFNTGQIHDSEVIGLMPVEALAGDQQDLLIPQQVKGKLFVIGDIKLLCVDLGENIEAGLRLYSADTGDIIESLGDEFSLLIHTTTGNNVVLNTLITAESSLNNGLGRHIGA